MIIPDGERWLVSQVNLQHLNNCIARAVSFRHTDKKAARHWLHQGRIAALHEVSRLGSGHPQWETFRIKLIRFEKRRDKRVAREWRKQQTAIKRLAA